MEGRVFDAAVEAFGQVHRASYYIEHGIVHARIGGRIIPSPIAEDGAEATVKRMLLGFAEKKQRRTSTALAWKSRQPGQ